MSIVVIYQSVLFVLCWPGRPPLHGFMLAMFLVGSAAVAARVILVLFLSSLIQFASRLALVPCRLLAHRGVPMWQRSSDGCSFILASRLCMQRNTSYVLSHTARGQQRGDVEPSGGAAPGQVRDACPLRTLMLSLPRHALPCFADCRHCRPPTFPSVFCSVGWQYSGTCPAGRRYLGRALTSRCSLPAGQPALVCSERASERAAAAADGPRVRCAVGPRVPLRAEPCRRQQGPAAAPVPVRRRPRPRRRRRSCGSRLR